MRAGTMSVYFILYLQHLAHSRCSVTICPQGSCCLQLGWALGGLMSSGWIIRLSGCCLRGYLPQWSPRGRGRAEFHPWPGRRPRPRLKRGLRGFWLVVLVSHCCPLLPCATVVMAPRLPHDWLRDRWLLLGEYWVG